MNLKEGLDEFYPLEDINGRPFNPEMILREMDPAIRAKAERRAAPGWKVWRKTPAPDLAFFQEYARLHTAARREPFEPFGCRFIPLFMVRVRNGYDDAVKTYWSTAQTPELACDRVAAELTPSRMFRCQVEFELADGVVRIGAFDRKNSAERLYRWDDYRAETPPRPHRDMERNDNELGR